VKALQKAITSVRELAQPLGLQAEVEMRTVEGQHGRFEMERAE
jgi:hypothetical protein